LVVRGAEKDDAVKKVGFTDRAPSSVWFVWVEGVCCKAAVPRTGEAGRRVVTEDGKFVKILRAVAVDVSVA
jgi:hypothetical protein